MLSTIFLDGNIGQQRCLSDLVYGNIFVLAADRTVGRQRRYFMKIESRLHDRCRCVEIGSGRVQAFLHRTPVCGVPATLFVAGPAPRRCRWAANADPHRIRYVIEQLNALLTQLGHAPVPAYQPPPPVAAEAPVRERVIALVDPPNSRKKRRPACRKPNHKSKA